jgi:CRP/FNR family transcriptional regulator
MLATAASTPAARPPLTAAVRSERDTRSAGERIAEALALLQQTLPVQRRVVHAGDTIYQAGERFGSLHVVHSGVFKIINLAADGREQVTGFHFKGDWLGFDGIATGRYGCDAVAMDTGEVWSFRYETLLQACAEHPALMALVHAAMSREIARDRDSLLSLCTLSADARVADFLRYWTEALATRGLRTDQITLRLTRAEIGNYLGMKLETVSRAMSRLARDKVICFAERGRRDVQIPDVGALSAFIQRSLGIPAAGAATALQ